MGMFSAGELGDLVHAGAVGAFHAVTSPFYNGGAAIGSGAADFVRGLVTGHAVAQANAAAAPAAAPAKSAPAKAGNPDAGPVVTLGDGTRVVMPSAAWLAAHPAEKVDMSQAPVAAAAAAQKSSGPQSPLDVVKQAEAENPGMSRAQLAQVVAYATKLAPVKAQLPKDQAVTRYTALAEDYAQRTAADPNYAKSQAGTAQKELIDNYRPVIGAPNMTADTLNAGAGMPPQPDGF